MKHTFRFLMVGLLAFWSMAVLAQSPKADRFLTITIAVVNSELPYHVALVRYFDKEGNILLNTSEEYKIDISKTNRFKTGSIRKTIPIFPDAERIQVSVNNCTGLHESDFLVSELDAAQNEVTFVFKREFEKVVVVKFKGIQQKRPCSFKIKGVNTNIIYYGDFVNAQKQLPEESRREDVNLEVAESTLYPYRIVNINRDVAYKPEDRERIIEVTVEAIEQLGGQNAGTATANTTTAPAINMSKERQEGESRKDFKKRLKQIEEIEKKAKESGTTAPTGGN
jgi:hypothetical protein